MTSSLNCIYNAKHFLPEFLSLGIALACLRFFLKSSSTKTATSGINETLFCMAASSGRKDYHAVRLIILLISTFKTMIVLIHQAGPCSGNCCQSKSGKEKWPADKPLLSNHPPILDADSVYGTPNSASWKTPGLHFGPLGFGQSASFNLWWRPFQATGTGAWLH